MVGLAAKGQNQPGSELSTNYFDFQINYWVNLHHFLFQRADSSQLQKLNEDGLSFLEIGEGELEADLSLSEKRILNEAIQYYRDSLVTKSLRRDLNELRLWLSEQNESEKISDISFGRNYTEIINKVSPVYRAHYWDLHKSHNLQILSGHITTIDGIETRVINQMEELSLTPWPDSTKVRVDISVYANWAGAYTTSTPEMNIIISSIDPSKVTSAFVETVLHEGSHLLYLYGESPVRERIFYKSEELEMDFPRNLWHASMFYLCGRATQDALAELEIEHELIMDERNIFCKYNTQKFREVNEEYFNRIIDMDEMVEQLLNDLKNISEQK